MKCGGVVLAVFVVISSLSAAFGQSWDPDKYWYAGDLGSPNDKRYVDDDGTYPGWLASDALNKTHNEPTDNPGGVTDINGLQLEASRFRVTNGKEKHRTDNGVWVFDATNTTRSALFWRIYIPQVEFEKMPSVQICTRGYRYILDFYQAASGEAGGSGWVPSYVAVDSGGLPTVGGGRYLPMSLGVWHTLRVEIGEGNQMEAWVDEEEGLSDVKHIAAHSTSSKDGNYIEIGCRSTVPYTEFWSNEVAWGQDIDGGANQIAPLMSPNLLVEVCGNGIDDDEDGRADCWDPGCLCNPVVRCTNDPVFDATGGGELGDEPDGQVDLQDWLVFETCATAPDGDPSLFDDQSPNYLGDECWCMDIDHDNDIDQDDFGAFQECFGLTGSALTECDGPARY